MEWHMKMAYFLDMWTDCTKLEPILLQGLALL